MIEFDSDIVLDLVSKLELFIDTDSNKFDETFNQLTLELGLVR